MTSVLISGGGIAGLTLGILLKGAGFEPLVVEREPVLRAEGYMMDFFGLSGAAQAGGGPRRSWPWLRRLVIRLMFNSLALPLVFRFFGVKSVLAGYE